MNTNEKGNIGLANTIKVLCEKGYFIFLPFTDTTCVDLIVANQSMKTIKVQVKHIKIRKGCIVVKCTTVIHGKDVLIDKKMVDYFIVYCPDNQQTYYLPINVFGNNSSVTLRVDTPKLKMKNIKYCEDFSNFGFEL